MERESSWPVETQRKLPLRESKSKVANLLESNSLEYRLRSVSFYTFCVHVFQRKPATKISLWWNVICLIWNQCRNSVKNSRWRNILCTYWSTTQVCISDHSDAFILICFNFLLFDWVTVCRSKSVPRVALPSLSLSSWKITPLQFSTDSLQTMYRVPKHHGFSSNHYTSVPYRVATQHRFSSNQDINVLCWGAIPA